MSKYTPYCDAGICLIDENSAAIRIEGLYMSYEKTAIFKNLSLDISPCTVTAIVGPSGTGKSSFLSCLNRMFEMEEGCQVKGSIRVFGKEIFDAQTKVLELRKKVGMIFQKPNPFPLCIRKNIEIPLKYHGWKNKKERQIKMENCLEAVGLWDEVKDRLNDPAFSLSGGQQQRLCIARAIALDPEILLMDEPCSALDPIATQKIEALINRLRQEFTIVIVTHNLHQAKRISDRTILFWRNHESTQIMDQGPTHSLFARPNNNISADFLGGAVG